MQRPDTDFYETYSLVMGGITLRYLISLAIQSCLSMQLMDVVSAYLYGLLDSNIYMKVLNWNPNTKSKRKLQHVLCKAIEITP